MSIFDTYLAKRQTLSDFCEHRATMVRLVTEHFAHFEMTKAEMKKFYQYGMPRDAEPHGNLKDAIKSMDIMYWRQSFDHTGLMQLLDAESKKKFEQQLHEKPPAFTIENVQSSFLDLAQSAEKMFDDGVVNVFRKLSDNYKCNDDFKIGDKVVITWMIETRYSRGLQIRSGMAEDSVNDIDRVFKSLDGKKHNPRELSNAMNNVFQSGAVYDDEYLTGRAFKNGNLHLKFKRPDIIDKVNLIIAKRYGATLGGRNGRV